MAAVQSVGIEKIGIVTTGYAEVKIISGCLFFSFLIHASLILILIS